MMYNKRELSPPKSRADDGIKHRVVNWLLSGGMGFDKTKDAIGNEVLFSSMLRRADLLVFSGNLHALEIKSDSDNLTKLSEQLHDYCRSFDKVSVVTTPKHLPRIQKILSRKRKVGLIVVRETGNIEIVRDAIVNKKLDKQNLLMFLNKVQVAALAKTAPQTLATDEIRKIAAKQCSLKLIKKEAYNALRKKYERLFSRFVKEFEKYPFVPEEILHLTLSVSRPRNPKK